MNRILICLICSLTCLLPLHSEVTASLLTASPGAEIYELDGHTGLRLNDPSRQLDMVVNWGVFDFDTPNFVYRFVKGETDYCCAAIPAHAFINAYLRQGRTVTEQTLALTPTQADSLLTLTLRNLLPANRVYRYSYIFDNCATRPLQLIEQAAGRSLIPDGTPSNITFRDEMTANHRAYPWYQFGIDLALGSGLDAPISTRALTFSPLQLSKMLEADSIVSSTVTYGIPTLTHQPTQPWFTPMAAALALLLITICISVANVRRHRISRWFDTALFAMLGLAGCVITFLVFVSSHSATSPNWLLMWINPMCLLAAILPWIKSAKKWLICYHFLNFAVLIVGSLLWPLTGQVANVAVIPWLLSDIIRSATNIYVCRPRN